MSTTLLTIDLHLHSTASDGTLSPAQLVDYVSEQNVQTMALTDHDTTAGLAEAKNLAEQKGIHFINGVELSVSWENKTLHILGLGINPDHSEFRAALNNLYVQRQQRAEKIAAKLEAKGISGALQGAKQYAGDGLLARPHFARYLVEQGYARDMQKAFDHYLLKNKPGYVSTAWPQMDATLNLIQAAGGVAVLAHPLRYKLSKSWMRRLLAAFKEGGGRAIEIVCGHYSSDEIATSAGYAERFGLMGSVGSDFHSHTGYGSKPGRLRPLPAHITPVWELFNQ